ncbi:MAG: hypothetical protein QOD03_1252 [Verrucomicrobiota bacterium]|jgi:hypothetical protein
MLFNYHRFLITMNFNSRIKLVSTLSLGLILAGCDRSEVKVQRVPKESQAIVPTTESVAAPATPPMNPHAGMNAAQPQLKWTLPDGWEEKPASQMRAASFTAKGSAGQTADVSVIPLPATGREVDLVNMWRQQMHLPQTTEAAAAKQSETISIGTDPGKLFDIASEENGAQPRARLLVAMVTRGELNWFFKMAGEDAFVREQKPEFVQFLKSVRFEEPKEFTAAELTSISAPTEPPKENSDKPVSRTVPAGWQEGQTSQFLLAKYIIPGDAGAQADVNISMLAGEGGGLMSNVNRWRGQLGLAPITSEEDWSKVMTSLEVPGGKATLVDMTGTDARSGKKARLIGVIMPQAGQTWFYKMMGDAKIVEQQKETFLKFVQSAPFSNAP